MDMVAKIETMPFIGNIVHSSYIIKSSMFSRQVGCWSIRIFPNEICGSEMIVTTTELFRARSRFLANAKDLRPQEYGKFEQVTITSNNWNKAKLQTNLIYLFGSSYGNSFSDNNGPSGYMFSGSELKEIAERTSKLQATVMRPSFWQKVVMFLACKFGSITVRW